MSRRDVETSESATGPPTGWAPSQVLAVVGPTAAGKSAIALTVAERLDAEIVNADAFQFYRGMDVGTAKATPAERARVPHHLLDVLDLDEAASVAEFQRTARAAVSDILARGRRAIVVGGSALYVRALCDELRLPPRDPQVRARYQALADELPPGALHAELRRRDPAAAAHIDPGNLRRLVRALEVVELTGSFTARLPDPSPWRPTLWVAPAPERPTLDRRIEDRVARMWAAGLPDEVAALMTRGLAEAPTAAKAVGYPQTMAYLAGHCDAAEARAQIVRATRALARRQERTFRADARVRRLAEPPAVIADRLVAAATAQNARR